MNPIQLSQEIERRYRQYLSTTFYFRDPELRASFEYALRSGQLTKGPFLEATPVFKRGQLTREVIHLLGVQPDEGFIQALHPRLFWHQESAITRILRGHNVIVATGTGSGKTEVFLYPILLHLYEEFQKGILRPGVRALILYPMNALANDQRERLGGICQGLQENGSSFRFTFGQYIGETPEDENDSHRHARDHIANRLPGELVLRSEMRRTPPHILLTNYSMLEYLLLRPADSPLFDAGQARWWKFLVLDEAHQYRGSRGIEMAMLLRRLKERLRQGGRSEPFRCIATSATLLEGKADRAAVAQFASDLFGEPFQEEDVILGETEPLPEAGTGTLFPEDYGLLLQILNDKPATIPEELSQIAAKLGVRAEECEGVPKAVGAVLERDRRTIRLLREISDEPREVQQIADQVFGDLLEEQRVQALIGLVSLLLQAKSPGSGAPLLSSRYHLFLRSLEGAFVAYYPRKRVFLERRVERREGAVFEVALCRECGQHYFVGRVQGGKLVEAIRDPSHEDFGATFFRPIENGNSVEDALIVSSNPWRLCLRCGAISKGELNCGHPNTLTVIQGEAPQDEDRKDQLARCSVCGYHAAGRDPVREVVHGTDGPNAVIATTLYRQLPEDRRKILAFADGRQQAAFFAWYLESSYRDILSRNIIFRVGEELASYAPAGLSLRELATGLRDLLKREKILPATRGDLELRREAWLWLYREFLTDEPRISLEGVGLARWSIQWPDWFRLPQVLLEPPWSLSEQEAQDLLFILLDAMRADRAVELHTEKGISLQWADLGLQASQMRFRVGAPQSKYARSWDGKTTKRVRLLSRLLVGIQQGISAEQATDEAVSALRHLWDHIRECDAKAPSSNDLLLVSVNGARRLNPDWWRLHIITSEDTLFQCDTCGRIQAISIRGVCPRYRCPGTLKAIVTKTVESNHYRLLYQERLPGILRVEEHTAQLAKEKARKYQQEFRDDKIHVLSCSTTFELGVNLGNLDTIFLRNVPPEAFNYTQRVGRAGRSSGHPGIAITYCRRGPHDLYHFARPERMLSGKVRPPILSLRNEKIITRHIAATVFSAFFRSFPQRFKKVEDFFVNLKAPSVVRDLRKFLSGQQGELERCLRDIIPQEMHARVGLDDSSWIERVAGEDSRFVQAKAEVSGDYKNVVRLRRIAFDAGDDDTVRWAGKRVKTIANEDVLSFLSRKAVIPKYGFPVDVVELDTQRAYQGSAASEVLLQRDLSIAIAEFAPTSKLVANKRLWVSHGLKRVAEREWPRRFYKRCVRHNVFLQWQEGEAEPSMPCGCSLRPRKYIVPRFGFITNRDKPSEPRFRPPKVFTTRPYFAGLTSGEPNTLDMPAHIPLVTMKQASPGLMVVLCEGRRGEGFYICNSCGSGFRSFKSPHKTPYGSDCRSTLSRVSLGHEFITDVLQIQFRQRFVAGMEPVWFGFSLAYAVVEGAADVLEVPSIDLSATIAYDERYDIPPIILYDNVPGGAGLVARLEREETLRHCLEAALERVGGNCGCDEDTSCYGCLRAYRNQFAHQHLQRGAIRRYLEDLIDKWQ